MLADPEIPISNSASRAEVDAPGGLSLRRQRVQAALLAGLLVFLAACRKESPLPEGRTPPNPSAPARYGAPKGTPSASIQRVKPVGFRETNWQSAPFFVIETELSPAKLVHSASRYLGLFTGLSAQGLGAPTHVAWSTASGPRSFKNGESLDVSRMEENWVLVWFSGATGWTNWDSPWAVFLQHKPASMKLDADGLHFTFSNRAGDVVLMPLYGAYKPPLQGYDFLEQHGLPSKKIKTWEWAAALPRDPLVRLRFWAGATRRFPLHCEDSFSVNRADDSVTIRSRFEWHVIEDEWKTKPLTLAPLSPTLALAAKDAAFPVQFSAKPFDLEIATPYGPYFGIPDADGFDATFSVLQYVNETEAVSEAETNAHPIVVAALERLRQTAREKFKGGQRFAKVLDSPDDFSASIQAAAWSAKSLPYYDPQTRTNALASLRSYFAEDVLVTNRFILWEHPKGSGRQYRILAGTGVATADRLGDAGRLSANLLETLWAYAHFSGDWELIRERWPLVKSLFSIGAETRWVGFGRDGVAALGDEAAPCAAFARLAYQVGDMDSYGYGCSLFARKLVHLWVKQRGSDYFRSHQPVHTMEFMDASVFLTHLRGGVDGWQIDGPKFPAATGERLFEKRWVRFNDWDLGRFYQDYLRPDVRRELDGLLSGTNLLLRTRNEPHGLPSFVQLRSLLLDESPAQLAAIATPDRFAGSPAGIIASSRAVLRTIHPTRFERLIPPGNPTPFVPGLEREVSEPDAGLVVALGNVMSPVGETPGLTWPNLTWSGWTTPAGGPWTFGQIKPVRSGAPRRLDVIPLNWNTRVVLFESAR